MNCIQPILHHGLTHPDFPAILEGDRTITYGELAAVLRRTATHLRSLGLAPGDRVGICLKDTATHVIALLACGVAGLAVVVMDWRARAAENARVAAALTLKAVLTEDTFDSGAAALAVPVDSAWHRAVERAPALAEPPSGWSAPYVIAATSGTTGLPKFTLATHLQTYMRFGVTSPVNLVGGRARGLCSSPLYFESGRAAVMAHLLRGDTVVLYPALVTAAEFAEIVGRHEIGVAYVVPMMVRQLLLIAPRDRLLFPAMQSLRTGGAPLFAAELRDACDRLTPNFCNGYGASAIGTIATHRPGEAAAHASSVGQIHPLVEAEIVGEDDRLLAPEEVGRFRCRGPAMGSPLDRPGESDDFRQGWHYPGEIAMIDRQGYLHILGRTSEVILRGGAKIHPAEIEAVLQEHPDVVEAAVVGGRAKDNEEFVAAFVVARKPVDASRLLALCRSRLTPYKVPSEIRVVGELPRNTAGKVRKSELAAILGDK